MKNLILAFLVLSFTIFSCERSKIDGVDILGRWLAVEQSCDSCLIYEFLDSNVLMVFKTEIDRSYQLYYKLYFNDKIEIENNNGRKKYDMVIHSNEEIEIIGYPGLNSNEMNTKLKRLNQ